MSDQSVAIPATQTDDPHDEIAVINQRISDLIAGQHQARIWYRNPSFITSIAAIFISVMTTAVSWYRTYQQDVTSLRAQLASTLQQASTAQMQHIELMAKYKDDQTSFLGLSVLLNQQNLILAKQAYALARALGSAASAVNLTTIAGSLMQSNEVTLAEDLLRQAIARAENSVEYVQALRSLGRLQYYNGQRNDAETSFNKALDAFKIYPGEAKSQDYVRYTHAYTHFHWAQGLYATDCRATREHLTLALQQLAQMSPASRQQVSASEAEFNRAMQMVANCK